VSTSPLCLNVGAYFRIMNFGVMSKNQFHRENWIFVLKVGPTMTIKNIDYEVTLFGFFNGDDSKDS
jgi:hypothetical protein